MPKPYTHRVTFTAIGLDECLWGRRWCRSVAEGERLAAEACEGLTIQTVIVQRLQDIHA